MRLRASGLTAIAVAALLITACGGGGATNAPARSAGASSGAPTTGAASGGASAQPSGGTADRCPSGDAFKIGAVTDVGQLEDKSFNEFTFAGVVDAATELGGTCDVIVTEEIADYANNIQTFVDEDFDAIVTIGFLLGTDTLNAAKENPEIFFIGIDQSVCVDEEGNNDATFACKGDPATLVPNYQAPAFAEGEPGYLAGIVAANITESDVIGAVGGTNVPAVVRYRDGYMNGAHSVNPDIQVLYVESNPDPVIGFNDPDRGHEIADQMIDQDADVIFQIAGGTGVGVLESACAAEIYGIGVDVDQFDALSGSNPAAAECI